MVRVGIIGLGYMAATHLKSLRQVEGARVTALCNPSGRHLDGDFSQVAGNLPGQEPLRWHMKDVAVFRDVEAFLGHPELDLVDICSPTSSHHSIALAAFRAGRHVICEKPMARTSAQALEMIQAARECGRQLMPAMCLRFLPSWTWLKQAIQERTYGRLYGVHFRRVAQPPGWGQSSFMDGAKSGGALLDLHIHDADFVRFCFGQPRSVVSRGFSKVSGAIDHVITHYEVGDGAVVSAEGGWAMAPGFGFNMAYTAVFDSATADYDLSRGGDALKLFRPGHGPEVLSPQGPDGYVGELQYMVDCIRSGSELSVVTAEDGLEAVRLCEAEERSVMTGEKVALTAVSGG